MNMPQVQENNTATCVQASIGPHSLTDLGMATSSMNSINFQEKWWG